MFSSTSTIGRQGSVQQTDHGGANGRLSAVHVRSTNVILRPSRGGFSDAAYRRVGAHLNEADDDMSFQLFDSAKEILCEGVGR